MKRILSTVVPGPFAQCVHAHASYLNEPTRFTQNIPAGQFYDIPADNLRYIGHVAKEGGQLFHVAEDGKRWDQISVERGAWLALDIEGMGQTAHLPILQRWIADVRSTYWVPGGLGCFYATSFDAAGKYLPLNEHWAWERESAEARANFETATLAARPFTDLLDWIDHEIYCSAWNFNYELRAGLRTGRIVAGILDKPLFARVRLTDFRDNHPLPKDLIRRMFAGILDEHFAGILIWGATTRDVLDVAADAARGL